MSSVVNPVLFEIVTTGTFKFKLPGYITFLLSFSSCFSLFFYKGTQLNKSSSKATRYSIKNSMGRNILVTRRQRFRRIIEPLRNSVLFFQTNGLFIHQK